MNSSSRSLAHSSLLFISQTNYPLSLTATEKTHGADAHFLAQMTQNFIHRFTENYFQYHATNYEENCVKSLLGKKQERK
jgi:hypothetical protein